MFAGSSFDLRRDLLPRYRVWIRRRRRKPGILATPRLVRASRPALRSGSGRGRLRQRKDREEALDRRPLAFDPYVPRVQRLLELAAFVHQRPQHLRIALDNSVGPICAPTLYLEATVRDLDPETVLAEPELVAGVEPFRRERVEHRAEGEDERIDAQRSIAGLKGERAPQRPSPMMTGSSSHPTV